MKIVREIRDGVVDANAPLSSVLRKAKILAVSLGNQEFRRWVDCELNGYSERNELPSYRRLNSSVLGHFSGPFGDQVRGYQLPVALMPDTLKEAAGPVFFFQSIKEIESLAATDREGLTQRWPAEAVMLLQEIFTLTGGFKLIEIYRPIGKAQLEGILDAVRNRLLDFLLALQEIDPEILDSEKALGRIPSERVSQVFNVSIQGNHNILAGGTGVNQQVTETVTASDKKALMSYLRGLGIANGDLQALDRAITADGPPQKKKLGKKVTEWLGKVVGNAVDGTWKAAMAAAPSLITKAISKYYGWD